MTNPGPGTRTGRRMFAGGAAAGVFVGLARPLPAQTRPDDRLRALGLDLPAVGQPIANFVQFSRDGRLVFVSGQLPLLDGKTLHPGRVGIDVTPEQANQAARQCALNVLAVARAACGSDLRRVRACLRLEGFVACDPAFTAQPAVVNGASDLVVAVLGDAGRYARSAVGVTSLPLNAPVEVAAVFATDL